MSARPSFWKRVWIAPIRFYQKKISPALPACCRYMPTCSQYAIEAIEKRGAFVGIFLAVRRILRCNPFGGYGYDPVPERRARKKPAEQPPVRRFHKDAD